MEEIYSKIDFNNKYSDLTINAVNQLEDELKKINISKIKFEIYKYNVYILLILTFIFLSFLNIKKIVMNSIHRLINKNEIQREVPFSLYFVNSKLDNYFYPNENLKLVVKSYGDVPNKIDFHIKNFNTYKKISSQNADNEYLSKFKWNFQRNNRLGKLTINEPLLPFNKYEILTDTFYIKIKNRPEIKNLDIYFEPPSYTNIEKITHSQSIKNIEILESSVLNIITEFDTDIKNVQLIFNNDSIENIINNSDYCSYKN